MPTGNTEFAEFAHLLVRLSQAIQRHFYLKKDEVLAQCERWITETEELLNHRPVGRAVSHHVQSLKQNTALLRQELDKLQPPEPGADWNVRARLALDFDQSARDSEPRLRGSSEESVGVEGIGIRRTFPTKMSQTSYNQAGFFFGCRLQKLHNTRVPSRNKQRIFLLQIGVCFPFFFCDCAFFDTKVRMKLHESKRKL